MKVFIDFDDVIFNTKEFAADLRALFELCGVTQEIFQKNYYDPNDHSEIKLFDPEGVFARLEEYEKMETASLREKFAQRMQDLSSFIFSDVEDFLTEIVKKNVYLISFGLPVFQNEKIVASGVHNLVSGCIVTKGSKAEAIRQVMEKINIDADEKIIFIDDRVEQVQDIKKTFPAAVTFLLCRKEGRYCDIRNEFCDYEIHSLKEAREIMNNILE